MTKKKSISKTILFMLSLGFVILFLLMLTLSILTNIFSESNNLEQGNLKYIISFFNWLSKFDAISDPFSIFMEILTSIGGVFFGIRIGQWIDDKEDKEKISELWKKINSFLKHLKDDINDDNISIYELAEYKIYWDSLQRADNIATRFLQDDDRYVDISFTFSFLAFYDNSWRRYKNINEWKNNATTLEADRIQNWIDSFDDLISYTERKIHC